MAVESKWSMDYRSVFLLSETLGDIGHRGPWSTYMSILGRLQHGPVAFCLSAHVDLDAIFKIGPMFGHSSITCIVRVRIFHRCLKMLR